MIWVFLAAHIFCAILVQNKCLFPTQIAIENILVAHILSEALDWRYLCCPHMDLTYFQQHIFYLRYLQSWTKISRQLYSGIDNFAKNRVSQQRIQQVSHIHVFLFTIYFRSFSKQCPAVDIQILLHKRMCVSKSGHFNIAWRKRERSGNA